MSSAPRSSSWSWESFLNVESWIPPALSSMCCRSCLLVCSGRPPLLVWMGLREQGELCWIEEVLFCDFLQGMSNTLWKMRQKEWRGFALGCCTAVTGEHLNFLWTVRKHQMEATTSNATHALHAQLDTGSGPAIVQQKVHFRWVGSIHSAVNVFQSAVQLNSTEPFSTWPSWPFLSDTWWFRRAPATRRERWESQRRIKNCHGETARQKNFWKMTWSAEGSHWLLQKWCPELCTCNSQNSLSLCATNFATTSWHCERK